MWPKYPLFHLSILLVGLRSSLAQEGTVSIFDAPALIRLRPCAGRCVDSIANYIECPTSPIANSCFCRTDLTDIARSSILNCVKNWCNGGVSADATSMSSIYTAYCNEVLQRAGVPTGQTPADPTETGGNVVETSVETLTTTVQSVVTRFSGTITTEVKSEKTVVIYSTITTVLSDETLGQLADEFKKEQGGGGGLEKGYQVAIGVGVVAIVIIILLLFMNKIRRRWFDKRPISDPPQPPMGGIQGTGEQPVENPQFYNYK